MSSGICYASTSEQCVEVDLNAEANSPLKKIPVYDQDGTGTCWSDAASVVLDFQRFRQDPNAKDHTDPMQLAIQARMKKFNKKDFTYGGQPEEIIESVRREGVCSQSEIDQRIRVLTKSSGLSSIDVYMILEEIKNQYGERGLSQSSLDGVRETAHKAAKQIIENKSDSCWVKEAGSIEKLADQIGRIFDFDFFNHPLGEIYQRVFGPCLKDDSISALPPYVSARGSATLPLIDRSLKQGLPAVISTAVDTLQCTKSRLCIWISSNVPLMDVMLASSGNHAMVVTGQAKINGHCSMLIRNSWGALWHTSGPCACEANNSQNEIEYQKICTAKKENIVQYLGCWVDKEFLEDFAYSAQSFASEKQ